MGQVSEEIDVVPVGPWRMPRRGADGVLRGEGGVRRRLLHVHGHPCVVAAWPSGGAVRFRAEAPDVETAREANARMRFAMGVDHDITEFQQQFKRHPLLGPLVHRKPWLRPHRHPEPFEALAWAVCEQLIEGGRAFAIERKMVWRHGPSNAEGLRDVPSAETVAGLSPPELEACGLSHGRAISMVKAAREVARGRVDLRAEDPEAGWRRLRSIRGIGSWTVESLALYGQGRDDQLPHGDLAYVKLVGNLAGLGRRATEDEVRDWFSQFAPYAGLAGTVLANAMAAGAFGPSPGAGPPSRDY